MSASERLLPFRTALHPGQSLESFVESLAVDYGVSPRMMLKRLGVQADNSAQALLALDEDSTSQIARICDLEATRVTASTMDYFQRVGVAPADYRRSRSATAQWVTFTRDSGSRFCPRCLAEQPVVYPLAWHLQWSFVCPRHLCVLADTCPDCGHVPRSGENRRSYRIEPWRCQCATLNGGRTRRQVCGADLRETSATSLSADHPLVLAQIWIDALIGNAAARAPDRVRLCGVDVPHDEAILGLAQLVKRILVLRVDTRIAVTHNLGTPRRLSAGGRPLPADVSAQTCLALATADAATFGEAAAIAADCLAAPTLDRAAHDIARYSDLSRRPSPKANLTDESIRSAGDWRTGGVRVQSRQHAGLIEAIDIAGRAHDMTPSDKLTFRVMNQVPRRPRPTSADDARWPPTFGAGLSARTTPQVLWPNVIQLLPRVTSKGTGAFDVVAAMMLIRLGTFARWNPIALQLGLPASFARTPQSVMARLVESDMLDETIFVLDGLKECLDHSPPPIDYSRRRWVFRDLVEPGRGWRAACNNAGVVATERRRSFLGHALYELLTGSDARFRAQYALTAGEQRTAYKQFKTLEAAGVEEFLRTQAEKHLLRHRIDEPVQWAPEFDFDDGWRSPPPTLTRRLTGWTSHSRQGSLRTASRDHTLKLLIDSLATSDRLDNVLTDLVSYSRTANVIVGPTTDLAVADLYTVQNSAWVFGPTGEELLLHLQHAYGAGIDLGLWETTTGGNVHSSSSLESA